MNMDGPETITTLAELPDEFFSLELDGEEQIALSARIDMYALLADIFRYPDTMTRRYVRKGEFKSNFLRIGCSLPFELSLDDEEIKNLEYAQDLKDEDVEIEYIRLFEAGPGNPPCPLVEGIHSKKENGRKSIFKDLILFYNHFGLSYAEGNCEDRADHLIYELEFLHYLAFLELSALQNGRDAMPLRIAQRDFLERHPARWTGMIVDRVKEIEAGLKEGVNREVIAFYRNAIVITDRFVATEYEYMKQLTEN